MRTRGFYILSFIFIVYVARVDVLWVTVENFFSHTLFVAAHPFHFHIVQLFGEFDYAQLMIDTADINFLFFGVIIVTGILVYNRDALLASSGITGNVLRLRRVTVSALHSANYFWWTR